MSITAGELVIGQNVVSVDESTPISKVLSLMVQHDYSQIPVVNDQGKSIGLVTGDSIARVFMRMGAINPEDLTVKDAIHKLNAFSHDTELLELLDHLLATPTVVISDSEGLLCGVITFHDAIQYFRKQTLDILLVKDIETAHRQHISIIHNSIDSESFSLRMSIDHLNTSATETRAKVKDVIDELCVTHKLDTVTEDEKTGMLDKCVPIRKGAKLDDLTLSETIQLAQKVWPKLNEYYKMDSAKWTSVMNRVRDIRNTLMHFRDDTSEDDRKHLQFWANWFKNHRPAIKAKKIKTFTEPVAKNAGVTSEHSTSGYSSLAQLLTQEQVGMGSGINVAFGTIEDFISKPLPQTAREHVGWWSDGESPILEWLPVDWVVGDVNIEDASVTFTKSKVPNWIDLQNPKAVIFWCKKFDCTEEKLIAVIDKIGDFSDAVVSYFQSNDQ